MADDRKDIILCRVVELPEAVEEKSAVCTMFTEAYEVPRVSFDADVLRRTGLQVGSWFNWIVRDVEKVQAADIDAKVSQELDHVDLVRLDALYREMETARMEDGGKWPEYTGDGR